MDAYLKIAASVLEAERRPLGPRAILDTAYHRALVPLHLHGKTQHKTLQARISEDIVERREHSLFYRTEPGRFFLRKFLTDESLPEEFRIEFPARRRFRELVRGPSLAIECALLKGVAEQGKPITSERILGLLEESKFLYGDPRSQNENLVFLRSFVCVHRENDLLSYRVGRYRDDRDSFMSRRSIGFSTFVSIEDRTLFNFSTFGILEAGINAAKVDLDIPDTLKNERLSVALCYFIWSASNAASSDLLAVIEFECPSWFEPLKRRLALNDLRWLDVSRPVNDIDDFDPWSKLVLTAHYESREAGYLDADCSRFGRHRRRLSQVPT